jgi:glycerol-3-phosphate dehydrogenase
VTTFDVAVIGAGVVGAAIARELARYDARTVLLNAADDVGTGTSKANTAIWHTGFDATPGSLESKLLQRAYPLMAAYADEVGIPIERTGALLVAWTEEQKASLEAIRAKAVDNGVSEVKPVPASALYDLEPSLGPGALGGLFIAGESILCPYTPPLAFATQAVVSGVSLRLRARVVLARRDGRETILSTADGASIRTRWVVNAAGLYSDAIDRLFGHARFTVTPRRGELIVFDKLARSLVRHVLLPVPTKTTKGVLVSPTVFGNVLLGPTAEDVRDKEDTATTEVGLASLMEKGRAILPELLQREVTATYAGLRAATEKGDYQIHLDASQRYVCVGGIRSTGLSASLGIAEYVAELLEEAGLGAKRTRALVPIRMPHIGSGRRPFADEAAIARDPDYGRIVCHCERVTRGELLDATRTPIPATTLDGLRRRTRCLQGRCQGFHCLAEVTSLLARASGRSPEALLALDAEGA